MNLQGVIEKLRKMIETQRRYLAENETRTRQALIDPLLRELGWDVSDPDLVELEYWVKKQRADYALMSDGQPVAVIEAKKLGVDLEDQIMQALNYANAGGIPYMIVTDGDKWEMYEVFKRGALEERLLMKFRLSEQPAHKNALQALAMWTPNLASDGSPSEGQRNQFLYHQRPIPDQSSNQSNEQQEQQQPDDSPKDVYKCYSFASERRYPLQTTPIRLKIGAHIERQVNFWRDVIHEVVVWLVDEGILSDNDCPIEVAWAFINSHESGES